MCRSGNSGNNETAKIPALCHFWRSSASSLPVIKLFGLDVSVTIASALVLTVVRYAAEYVMVTGFGWPTHSFVTKNAFTCC